MLMLINWFESWDGVLRIFVAATLSYTMLIFFLRISGKRTLGQMNAFDFIVTIAMGSLLATTILNKKTPVAEGMAAMLALIILQYCITWLSVRINLIDRIVKAQPARLVSDSFLQRETMRHERVTEEEIHAVLRENGIDNLNRVKAVVLETNGKLTVVQMRQD